MKTLVATRIEAREHQVLQRMAAAQDRTISYLVRKAVEQYVASGDEEGEEDRKTTPTRRA